MAKKKKTVRKKAAKKQTKNKVTAVARRIGRPTKYKMEFANQALVLAEKGFTDAEIADVFEVKEQTINNWKKKFPQFFESLKKGKAVADQKIVQSLYQRALGYSHPEVHITSHQGIVTKTNIIKHYPPDTTACIFWLKNRDQEHWRDKHEHELSGEVHLLPPKISKNG